MKVTVAGVTLAETKSFKYLGALFNSEASRDDEVIARLAVERASSCQYRSQERQAITLKLDS